jgi:signal transduction histidine kinase
MNSGRRRSSDTNTEMRLSLARRRRSRAVADDGMPRDRRFAPAKVVALEADLAQYVADLSGELAIAQHDRHLTTARLDRLRRCVDASTAAVWLVTVTRAYRLLHVDRAGAGSIVERPADVIPRDRLRRDGVVLCRDAELTSPLAALAPAGARSCVAAAALDRGELAGVLVLGWATRTPDCGSTGAALLRIAAGLLTRDVSAAHSPARGFAARLVAAQESERSRIARDLHDDIGQRLVAVSSKLTVAAGQHSRAAILAAVDDIRADVQDIAGSIHNLAHQLHPARLKLLGLVPTLRALCREIADQHSLQVAFRASGLDQGVPDDIAVCVFRVAQEALRNAVKHSGADTLDVEVSGADGQLTLRVADDGTGFSPVLLPAAGLGLHTMRERVESIGGRLTIEPAGRRGTLIEIVVPLPAVTKARTYDRATSPRRQHR